MGVNWDIVIWCDSTQWDIWLICAMVPGKTLSTSTMTFCSAPCDQRCGCWCGHVLWRFLKMSFNACVSFEIAQNKCITANYSNNDMRIMTVYHSNQYTTITWSLKHIILVDWQSPKAQTSRSHSVTDIFFFIGCHHHIRCVDKWFLVIPCLHHIQYTIYNVHPEYMIDIITSMIQI